MGSEQGQPERVVKLSRAATDDLAKSTGTQFTSGASVRPTGISTIYTMRLNPSPTIPAKGGLSRTFRAPSFLLSAGPGLGTATALFTKRQMANSMFYGLCIPPATSPPCLMSELELRLAANGLLPSIRLPWQSRPSST